MCSDLFDDKHISPMLIGKEAPAFDSDDYVYELKMDGVRCLAYFDKGFMDLRNKRHITLTNKFPEFTQLPKQVKKKCILDGELYVFKDGVNDFFAIQRRCLTSDPFKLRLMSKQFPATFTAFDILYIDGKDVRKKSLMERKKLLENVLVENELLNISRTIEKQGLALFQLTSEKGLEGIVAKKKTSQYHCNTRTKEWIKCKHMMDDEFCIVGYCSKDKGMVSLVLAQYEQQKLCYKGHVTMGVSLPYLREHAKKVKDMPFSILPKGNEDAIWISPFLVGTVKFMEYTQQGGLRQPVFKGFREDKLPRECIGKDSI